MIKPIYHNMDKLEVTFQGAFPLSLIELLIETKEEAQKSKKFIPLKLGKSKEIYRILPTGLGGFSLGFITADDGIQISTQKSDDKDLWNIFIGVRSWYLAINGYEASKERLLAILEDLGAKTHERLCPYTGEVTTRPLESIKRIDYCFDFKMPDFVPNKHHVLYHQSGKYQEDGFIKRNGQGVKDNALTFGTRASRQIQIYDKILEITQKSNKHWYDIWGLKPKDRKDIWRVECRFFKEFIRNHNLRTFYDLERNIALKLAQSFSSVRYVAPTKDSNRSRWPNADFWDSAKNSANLALKYKGCAILPVTVHEYRRQRSLEGIENMLIGVCVSKAVLSDIPYKKLLEVPRQIESDIKALIRNNPEILKKQYDDTYKRYFIDIAA